MDDEEEIDMELQLLQEESMQDITIACLVHSEFLFIQSSWSIPQAVKQWSGSSKGKAPTNLKTL